MDFRTVILQLKTSRNTRFFRENKNAYIQKRRENSAFSLKLENTPVFVFPFNAAREYPEP